jgi:stage III sporulation protein AG
MEISERIKSFGREKGMIKAVAALGMAGLLLLLISSLGNSGKKSDDARGSPSETSFSDGESYCADTERRLEDFLRNIDGAGNVRVYLTVSGEQRYVYATEGRKSRTDNKTEEEEKYVLVGGSGGKTALIETIEAPGIEGAVILCSGCDDPSVKEQIYRAASAALGINTAKIYVAKLK